MISGVAIAQEANQEGAIVFLTGALAYAIGPPTVHFVHHKIGEGFGSFLMLTLGPLVLAFAGSLPSDVIEGNKHCDFFCPTTGGLIGFFVGVLAAPIIDAAFLAFEEPAP